MKAYFAAQGKREITGSTEEVLRKIAGRYMAANPARPFVYRACSEKGLQREADGRVLMDFDNRFPEAENGDYAYAFAMFTANADTVLPFSFSTHNPSELYINGEKAAYTTIYDELLNEDRIIEVPVKAGTNTVFIKCRKNILGFRYVFGIWRHKTGPLEFYTAFADNQGELGWNYCGPFKEDVFTKLPASGDVMGDCWLPRPYTNELPVREGTVEMYAISTLNCRNGGTVEFSCRAQAELELYLDGVLCGEGKDALTVSLQKDEGTYQAAIRLKNIEPGCKWTVAVEGAEPALPDCVKDVRGCWLYLETSDEKARLGFQPYELYESHVPGEKVSFLCGKDTCIRPVLVENLFGRCTYPLGVVMYGLLSAGGYLQDEEILEYAHEHLKCCYASMEYALWDKAKFGFACVNHALTNMSFLDDCGSFASAVLEDYLHYHRDEKVRFFADEVADYVLNRNERLENGMFYRIAAGLYSQYTVWADDLYMSVPFMLRYFRLTGREEILEDVINQFRCYKEKLFMPEHNLMGHVYSLRHEKCTRVPWGRGNGWVLFSLSELLMVLPEEHKGYAQIKEFFLQLSKGFLDRIDEDGMLHQVLWDHDSFAEASCTAMCAVAFARGVRLGILPEQLYGEAGKHCVAALKKYCIDEEGNVYGVCRGSGYSFREDYYKYEIPTVLNDTHGTGIMLLAIVETDKVYFRDSRRYAPGLHPTTSRNCFPK